jgi:predicted alpha-1,6-mannanase (GH76 family)
MLRGRLAPRVAIITVTAAVVPLLGVTTASASAPAASPLPTGMTELAATYGTGAPDLFGDRAFGWTSAVAQSTVEAYEQATGDRRYVSDIAAAYSEYVSSDPSSFPDFEDNYIDDTGWWGIAWLQAYLNTGNSDYLEVAEADASYMHGHGWDTDSSSCGGSGGVWWYIGGSTPTGRLAIPNEVFLELTAWLYNVTKDSTYLDWANAEWAWFENSRLIDSGDQVYDGFNDLCTFVGANTWSYDQGVILGGLAQLYVATGDTTLLTEAEDIANAEINSSVLDPDGVLLEPCAVAHTTCPGDPDSFKGIFVQNLKMLATIARTSQFNSFFQDQAAAIGSTDINSSSQFGMFWDAPLSDSCSSITPSSWVSDEADNYCNSATQASALDALIAADDQSPTTLSRVEASAGSGYCLDNTGNSSSNGNPVQIWECNGDAAQNWEFIPDSNGIAGDYMLENGNGKCLDDPHDSTADGTKVQLWTCLGNRNQEWTQTAVGAYVEYVNSNGTCLDDTGNSHSDGTRVQVWSCNGDTAQQWEVPS